MEIGYLSSTLQQGVQTLVIDDWKCPILHLEISRHSLDTG